MSKLYLAPMEGLTGYVYRNAHRACFGEMDGYFTPFLASKKLSSKEKREVLPENNLNMNVIPQILTNRTDEFISIAKQLKDRGYASVNLNLGCPSGTVTAKNRGAGFLKVKDELEEFLKIIFEECPLKISIKTRIGAYHDEEFSELIEIYNKFPMEELIVHPRLMTDFYEGSPKYEIVEKAVLDFKGPLCYNGDVNSLEDYEKIQQLFPTVDRIMLGRGLLMNPALPRIINGGKEATTEELKQFHELLYKGYKEEIKDERNTLFKLKALWVYFGKLFEADAGAMKGIRKAESYLEYEIAVRNIMKCYTR